MTWANRDVRFTPESGHWDSAAKCPLCAKSGHPALRQGTSLFDHFVGSLLKVQGHVEAQSLGGPEIDDKLIFRWCLHRHVGRLLALEDAVDVAGRAPIHVDPIRPIGKKATSDDK